MEYSQSFSLEEQDIEGKLHINYSPRKTSAGRFLLGSLYLKTSQDLPSDFRIRITGKHGVIVSPAIIEVQEPEETFKLDLYLPSETSTLSISIETEDNSEGKSIGARVLFEDLAILSIGDEIFREETFEKQAFQRQVCQFMGSNGPIWPLINFAGELSQYTDLETYMDILGKFVEEYPEIHNRIDSVLDTILKRILLGKLGDGRHHIQSLSLFESIVEQLSRVHPGASVSPANAVRYALEELDKNGELEKIARLSHELRIIDLYPESVNDKLFYILLAEEVLRQSEEGARNVVDQYFSDRRADSIDPDTYDQLKSSALETENKIEKQSEWYKLLSSIQTSVDSSEFKFIVSNFLYWTANVNADDEGYYHVSPKLFRAAGMWAESSESSFAQRCYHEYNLRKGLYLFHNQDYSDSSEHFSSAISISSNQSREYNQPRPGWLEYPIIYKTLSDARSFTEDGNEEQAAELLQERQEELEDLTSISEEAKERIISAVGGERFRILADLFLEEGEYERAEEVLGRAVGLFKKGNLSRSAENTLQRKQEVKAVLKEVNGEFEIAADLHEDIANDSGYSESKQFVHRIRSDICHVKVKIRDKEYNEALDILKEINRRTSKLENEGRDLGILLHLLSSYTNDEVDDASRTLKKFSSQSPSVQSQHPLDVEYDYTEPIVTVLALQRLKQTDLPQDLLDALVDLSVQRALTPNQYEGVVDETYLGDISIDRLWRERLPAIVLNRVERIQLDSATVTGDYKSVTLLLTELLEFYLALLVEYHGKRYWGDSWRSELTTNDEDENNLSIGVLARIFGSDAGETIENNQQLRALYYSDIDSFSNLTEMRNHYDHGYEGYVNEDTFVTIREWVFDFLRESVQDSPLIISVEAKNAFEIYSIRLHWWRGQRRILLDTNASLETGTFYYLPAESALELDGQVIQTIDKRDIFEVDDQRVIDQVRDLPQYR